MELVITLNSSTDRQALFGDADKHLRTIRDATDVKISARGTSLKLDGQAEDVGRAARVIEQLEKLLVTQEDLSEDDVARTLSDVAAKFDRPGTARVEVFSRGAPVQPRTDGQMTYVDAMLMHDLTFCVGPAGTGKTYLAVAIALSLLKQQKIKRIVLARPAVEAGEKLGYLPGDIQAKVNPYLRPLYDAMHDMMDYDQMRRLMANDVIEVIPLAFMRGRTLNNSAIILDEAQNTTRQQMLMFLTRLGHHSKMIVTGDDSQVDLDSGRQSGLVDAVRRLQRVKGIAVVHLSPEDIVRHKLVGKIVAAYEDLSPTQRARKPAADQPSDGSTGSSKQS